MNGMDVLGTIATLAVAVLVSGCGFAALALAVENANRRLGRPMGPAPSWAVLPIWVAALITVLAYALAREFGTGVADLDEPLRSLTLVVMGLPAVGVVLGLIGARPAWLGLPGPGSSSAAVPAAVNGVALLVVAVPTAAESFWPAAWSLVLGCATAAACVLCFRAGIRRRGRPGHPGSGPGYTRD